MRANRDPGIEHAVELAGGTFQALAEKLDISASAVASWPRVPADRVLAIERLVPGTSRYIMRGDLYPVDLRDPDPRRVGIFQTHNCSRCKDGALPCVRGQPRQCEYLHARND
jgi:DNA-binding transcriptional regulator YdaS (Cro superfamily)